MPPFYIMFRVLLYFIVIAGGLALIEFVVTRWILPPLLAGTRFERKSYSIWDKEWKKVVPEDDKKSGVRGTGNKKKI
jgi:hypothetical protein